MALQQEGSFEASKEVDELAWLAPAHAIGRLDHEGERRLVQRCAARAVAPLADTSPSVVVPDVAAARAGVIRRLLAVRAQGAVAGLGPALDLLDLAEDAFVRGATRESAALVAEARRMSLLSLEEPELSLQARALREEARAFAPWRRRAIRKLLSADEPPSPEAVHLAAELRDRGREDPRAARFAPILFAAALAGLATVFWLVPAAARGNSAWAALCGSLAGAAIAALYRWRSGPE
jgi:hypothetical protein